MSEVTLESLHADVENARLHFADLFNPLGSPDYVFTEYSAEEWAALLTDEFRQRIAAAPVREAAGRLVHAVAVYQVARNHGLEAAMLYKLSGGNIDPRIAPGED